MLVMLPYASHPGVFGMSKNECMPTPAPGPVKVRNHEINSCKSGGCRAGFLVRCNPASRQPAVFSVSKRPAEPQLVILDTDIGDDIDDAFALALALKSPELNLLGITTTYGDTELRARLLDRFLSGAGRLDDVSVSSGVPTPHSNSLPSLLCSLGAENDLCRRHRLPAGSDSGPPGSNHSSRDRPAYQC